MTITNTTVKQTYTGDGSNTTFAIPFNYKSGTASDVTKVTLIKSDGTEEVLTEGTDYELTPAGADPSNADTSQGSAPLGAPASDQKLRVERESPRTQETDFDSSGSTTPYNATLSEDAYDKVTRLIQELYVAIQEVESSSTTTVTSGALIKDWAAGTDYTKDETVIFNTRPYRATSTHTAGGDFNSDFVGGKWELIRPKGDQGLTGPQGPTGAKGDKGDKGDQGPAGADGADGVFSQIASKAEAEAGIDNTKGMSPLRVAQALIAQLPSNSDFSTVKDDTDTNTSEISKLRSRVSSLESFSEFANGKFAGSQKLKNAQGAALELLGEFNPTPSDGKGSRFRRQSAGTEFAEVKVYIRRENDLGDIRFSSFDIIMQFVDGTWYIGRQSTMQLVESLDLDGVTLNVSTDVDGKGQVSYTTDDMGGTDDDFHFENSVIKWWGQEIPIGV